MKKSILLFVFLLLILSITGCSSDTNSDEPPINSTIDSNKLIIDSEIIDRMDIGVVRRKWEEVFGTEKRDDLEEIWEFFGFSVHDKEQVDAAVNLLKDIEVEVLPSDQAKKIFWDMRVLAQQANYEIQLYASSEKWADSLKGIIYVLREEKLIFIEPKISEEPQRIEDIVFYISKEKQTDVIDSLVEIIKEEAKR